MQKIIYVPPGKDESSGVELALKEPFILSSIKGVGGVECSMIYSSVVGMQSKVYQGFRKEPRVIECTVYVRGENRAEMYKNRKELIGLLKPESEPGTAYYSNDHITVKTAAVPQLPPDFAERVRNYNKADLKLWCPDPDWQALETQTASIAAQKGTGFSLPFKFPIKFSYVKNEITVQNNGTAKAPVTITITGPGVNPAITNRTNGKTIRLDNKSLGSGEQLIITTERGKKSVKLLKNGIYTDAFQYIDPTSKFWELEVGQNDIVYSSDDNSEATSIVISWVERYEGV